MSKRSDRDKQMILQSIDDLFWSINSIESHTKVLRESVANLRVNIQKKELIERSNKKKK